MDLFSQASSRLFGKARSGNYHRRKRARDRRTFLLLGAPGLIWYMLLMVWPLIYMFYISLLRWDGMLKPKTFIGLANYTRMIADPHFHHAAVNTGIHLLIGIPAVMPVAFILGFFLSQRPAGYRLLRVIFFIPAMASVAALAMMFVGIYLPDGILNTLLRGVGLEELTRVWLANTKTALPSIIAIDVWSGIGFYSVLFFAALSNVSDEIYEAALLDGAGLWTSMWRIAFPLSLDFFGLFTMLHFLWILLGAAQNVLLLTKGGPGDHTLTLGYYLYDQAFLSRRLGYSQALGVFIFIIGVLGMLIIRRLTMRRNEP
jgi:multiple sugar transport system permease protein